MSKAYTSNLTLEQWKLIEPLIPPAKSGGRPREVEVWDMMVNQAVGYDAGKQIKGRKRFLPVDTLGLVLRVYVVAASVGKGGKQVLQRIHRMGNAVSPLHTIWVDDGFDREPFMQWIITVCRWIAQVVLRPEQTKGFVLLKKRWVVERTFGWLMGYRRLVRDYERLPETSEALIYLAMIRIMLRRLA